MINKEYILNIIKNKDWTGLKSTFSHLTNAEFRKTEVIMRDQIMPSLSNDDFWDAYTHLLIYRRQSFLTCILSIGKLSQTGELNLHCMNAAKLVDWLNVNSPESKAKIVRMAVPLLTSASQIKDLFSLFGFDNERERVAILVKETTPDAYYLLFDTLKHAPENRSLLTSVCIALIQKGDDLSFNMASILKSYFDLDTIKSNFSLHIEAYELSYIDKSYDNFVRVLTGKRPSL